MPKIGLESLRAGDVLLYEGNSLISRLICKLDGSPYSHARLYLGEGLIGEALIVGNPGLNINTVQTSFSGSSAIAARRLHDENLSTEPILRCAHHYLEQGNRYAFEQLFLVACICLTRKVPVKTPMMRMVMKAVLQKATDFLKLWHRQGREPMICSEFVFRAYDEAHPEPDDPYSLRILSQAKAAAVRQPTRRRLRILRRGLVAEEQVNVHPESLLMQLKAAPDRLPMKAKSFDDAPVPITDAALDDAIAELLDEKKKFAATAAADIRMPVSDEELVDAASEFARQLADSTPEVQALSIAPSATPEFDKVVAALANFVTPGDLAKTPSLANVGELNPNDLLVRRQPG